MLQDIYGAVLHFGRVWTEHKYTIVTETVVAFVCILLFLVLTL